VKIVDCKLVFVHVTEELHGRGTEEGKWIRESNIKIPADVDLKVPQWNEKHYHRIF
jgi:hypothetical protein